MAELNEVAQACDAVLYIDDAHGTGVLGEQGRGTVLDTLGSYDNTFVVGSLSKAFSCAGGFIGCTEPFHRLLKIRSSPYVFGGPVVPCYLEAISAVIDILRSGEYERAPRRLDSHIKCLTRGLSDLGLAIMGGATPIVSVLVGDEADTLRAGKFLFDRGYYVQSVLFPAVPYHCGVLRVQCNANHSEAAIDGLLDAFADLAEKQTFCREPNLPRLPSRTMATRAMETLLKEGHDSDTRRPRSRPGHHAGRSGCARRGRDPAFERDEASGPGRWELARANDGRRS